MDKVVHFEIPADDVARAKEFYHSSFGWEMRDMPPEMNYTIVRTVEVDERQIPKEPGAINGGLFARSGVSPITGPSFSVNVKDIDATLEKIKKAGGETVQEKTPVGTMGFVAVFRDTEGSLLGLWQNT